jgi:hypothetical protein
MIIIWVLATEQQAKASTTNVVAAVSTTSNEWPHVMTWIYCRRLGHLRKDCREHLEVSQRAVPSNQAQASLTSLQPRGIIRVRDFKLPQVFVQLGHLTTSTLLDSGSVRLTISHHHLREVQLVDVKLRCVDTGIKRMSVSCHFVRHVNPTKCAWLHYQDIRNHSRNQEAKNIHIQSIMISKGSSLL